MGDERPPGSEPDAHPEESSSSSEPVPGAPESVISPQPAEGISQDLPPGSLNESASSSPSPPSPSLPEGRAPIAVKRGLLWILEEVVWLSVVFVAAVGAGVVAGALGGSVDAAALFGFHAGLLVYGAVRERAKLAAWFRPTRAALIWGIGTGIAMVVTGALYAGLLRVAGIEIPDMAAELRTIVPVRALLIFWGALVVPIAEELYFRGRLIDSGRKYFRTAGAVFLSALAFAAVHGVPVLIPAYAVLAWLLWKARVRTGGLVAPVIAHAVNNLLGLLTEGP